MCNIISLLFTRSFLAKTSLKINLNEVTDEWANEIFIQSSLTFDKFDLFKRWVAEYYFMNSPLSISPGKVTLSMEIPGWTYG